MEGSDKEFLGHYLRYKDKIYNYFWYRVGFDDVQAEDLTSEVFLKAYENFDTFDQARPFQAWIYKIAKNHLINHYRVQGREIELNKNEHDRGWDGARAVDAKLELEGVMQCIKNLEPYHRDVLLLRFVDGLDNREAAEVLGKDEGAVRTQFSRAMAALKKLIANYYG